MKESLITFDTAKLAKEKGFDVECETYWANYYTGEPRNKLKLLKRSLCESTISFMEWQAPTQSLLQKWLREKHDLHILIGLGMTGLPKYDVSLFNSKKIHNFIREDNDYTYEQALEKGLQEALKLIKI